MKNCKKVVEKYLISPQRALKSEKMYYFPILVLSILHIFKKIGIVWTWTWLLWVNEWVCDLKPFNVKTNYALRKQKDDFYKGSMTNM